MMTYVKNPNGQEEGENITLIVQEEAHQGPPGKFQNGPDLKNNYRRHI